MVAAGRCPHIPGMGDVDRIDALEAAVRSLAGEVRALRNDVERLARASPDSAAPDSAAGAAGDAATLRAEYAPLAAERHRGPARHVHAARLSALDILDRPAGEIEALVGRYGTVALATLTILMGAGAFLTWAIANDKIGPVARVLLGAIAAGGVAALGWRLRGHGAIRFGNTLLALALALVHVDAWGAGPYLAILSPTSALAVAAACSVSLAALALKTDEELLFMVGVGGALLAPFVTSVSETNPIVLLVYGLVVLAAGSFAVRDRTWSYATRLLGLGCAVYAAAGFKHGQLDDRVERNAPAVFALCCAWSAVVWPGRNNRIAPALSGLAVAATALLWVAATVRPAPLAELNVLSIAGAVSAYLVLRLADDRTDVTTWLAGALLLPLEYLVVTLVALPDAFTPDGARLAALWALLAALATWRTDGQRRASHLLGAALASGLAILLALHDTELALAIALAAYAVVWTLMLRRERTLYVLAPIVGALLVASGRAYVMLADRAPYRYAPFVTTASAAALAVVASWVFFSWQASRTSYTDFPSLGERGRMVLASLGVVAAFLWAWEELREAFAPDVATFLQIGFFASTGVLAIYLGRERDLPPVRRVGLALAVFAALMALWLASDLSTIGLRVGSYCLVGCFLYLVGYWYRVREEEQLVTSND
jgi:predicted membrane protein DUF2339